MSSVVDNERENDFGGKIGVEDKQSEKIKIVWQASEGMGKVERSTSGGGHWI
jgi:hypothetical protein